MLLLSSLFVVSTSVVSGFFAPPWCQVAGGQLRTDGSGLKQWQGWDFKGNTVESSKTPGGIDQCNMKCRFSDDCEFFVLDTDKNCVLKNDYTSKARSNKKTTYAFCPEPTDLPTPSPTESPTDGNSCGVEALDTRVNLAVAVKKGQKTPVTLEDEDKDPVCECAELCDGEGSDIFQYYSKVKKGKVSASCKCMSLGKKLKAKSKSGWTAGALTSQAKKAFNKMKVKVSKKDKKNQGGGK